MPEYHRLDLSLANNFKNYGYLKQNKYEMDTYQGFKMYPYQWVPSLTYNFWF